MLARSLKRHNPQIRFCLLINEPVPEWAIAHLDAFDEVPLLARRDGGPWTAELSAAHNLKMQLFALLQ